MEAYFVFEQESPSGEVKEFIIKLIQESKIQEARQIIDDGKTIKKHVHGTIVKTRVAYNPNWSFHLDPASIGFFELQIEVCDANVTYIEEHLDDIGGSMLPKCFWCPWSSILKREIR
jgi:hypothetical protein